MPPHQQPVFTFPARAPQSISPIAEHPPSPASPPPHPFAYPHTASGSVTEDVAFRGSTAMSLTSSYSTPRDSTRPTPPSAPAMARQLVVSPTPGSPSQPGGQMMRHHLPSRLTTPLPIPLEASNAPVPVDNFAAPRMTRLGSGDKNNPMPQAIFIPTHHQRGSSVSDVWQEKSEKEFGSVDYGAGAGGDGRRDSDEESRRRFTMGMQEVYAYNDSTLPPSGAGAAIRASTPGGAQGWEASKGERRKRAFRRWGLCLLVLVLIGVAVGVSVGLTRKKDAAAGDEQKESQSTNRSSLPTAIRPTTSSFLDRPLPSSASASASAPSSATPTPVTSTRTSASSIETFSTSYIYASASFTTTVPLQYTLPPSSARETRANGWLQFTQNVVLPRLGTQRGSFTSDLRFRVPPTAEAAPTGGSAGALKRRGHMRRLR